VAVAYSLQAQGLVEEFLSTYTQVQSRIADDINRSDLTSQIQQQIKLAIKHYRTFPFWFNEARATLTASSSASFLTVPTDYLDVVDLYIKVGGYPVQMLNKPLIDIVQYRPSSGSQPRAFCYFADRFELDCEVNTQYEFPLWYIKELTELSGGSDENEWLKSGEDLIVYRAEKMLYAAVIKDKAQAKVCSELERDARNALLRFRDQKIGNGQATAWGY
jgi:hypothetical protein